MPFKLYIRLLSQFVDNGMQIDLMENSCGPNDHLTFWRNCLSVLFHLPLAKKSREMSREHLTQPIELYTVRGALATVSRASIKQNCGIDVYRVAFFKLKI